MSNPDIANTSTARQRPLVPEITVERDVDLRDESAPLVSVIVPARNESSAIDSCIASILSQTLSDLEVLVVDGDSDDDTVERVLTWAETDRRVRLVHNPEQVIPRSLNLATLAARGTYIVRIDAHASVPNDYVERIKDHLATGEWGAVGGLKIGVGTTDTGRTISQAMASPFGVGNSPYHYGTGLREIEHVPFGAYPRDLIMSLGGWDETFLVHQDFEFDYRVRRSGHRILCDSDIVIDWECRQTIPDLAKQYFRYGKGKAHMLNQNPDSLLWRHLAPPMLVLAVVAGLAAALIGRTLFGLLPFIAYIGFLAFAAIRFSYTQKSVRQAGIFAAAIASMHVPWGAGLLYGMVRRKWS